MFFALFVFLFNTLVPIDVSAVPENQIVNRENLLREHNLERKKEGLSDLILNQSLNNSAQAKANAMLEANCWAHFCPDGRSPWEFFDDAGYDYVYAGENLAEGFFEVDDVIRAWMNSQTHRENILKKEYLEVGFGIVSGRYQSKDSNVIIVVHFGTSKNSTQFDPVKREIKITNPLNGSIVSTNYIDVEGNIVGLDNVKIVLNGDEVGEAKISNGIFTYRVESLLKGENSIYAVSDLGALKYSSNTIKINYDSGEVNGLVPSNQQTPPVLTMSPDTKNLVNLVFIAFFACLFLLDFLLVSRTDILKRNKSLSHFHFVIMIIIGGIIIAGGYSGNISLGALLT